MGNFLDDLPDDPVEGYLVLEGRLNTHFEPWVDDTSEEAKFTYIQWLRSYVLEHDLEFQLSPPPPISAAQSTKTDYVESTLREIEWWMMRYKVRVAKNCAKADPLEALPLPMDFRAEIHDHLNRIRKIVRSIDIDENQRERIFDRVNALAKEIDRERSRLAAFAEVVIEVTRVMGEGADNLEPVMKQLERVGAIFGRAKKQQETQALSPPEERRLLSAPEDSNADQALSDTRE